MYTSSRIWPYLSRLSLGKLCQGLACCRVRVRPGSWRSWLSWRLHPWKLTHVPLKRDNFARKYIFQHPFTHQPRRTEKKNSLSGPPPFFWYKYFSGSGPENKETGGNPTGFRSPCTIRNLVWCQRTLGSSDGKYRSAWGPTWRNSTQSTMTDSNNSCRC